MRLWWGSVWMQIQWGWMGIHEKNSDCGNFKLGIKKNSMIEDTATIHVQYWVLWFDFLIIINEDDWVQLTETSYWVSNTLKYLKMYWPPSHWQMQHQTFSLVQLALNWKRSKHMISTKPPSVDLNPSPHYGADLKFDWKASEFSKRSSGCTSNPIEPKIPLSEIFDVSGMIMFIASCLNNEKLFNWFNSRWPRRFPLTTIGVVIIVTKAMITEMTFIFCFVNVLFLFVVVAGPWKVMVVCSVTWGKCTI